MRRMINEFKKFIARGNVIDLAVGVIIGGAFSKITSSLVEDIIMPIIGVIIGKINFTSLQIVIKEGSSKEDGLVIKYGVFLQNIIDFLLIAFTIFLVIKLFNKFRDKKEVEVEEVKVEEKSEDTLLLGEIVDILNDIKNNK